MKKVENNVRLIQSVSEMHNYLGLPQPKHPLITVLHLEELKPLTEVVSKKMTYNFFQVCMKKNYAGKLKYGQQYYDFDNGILSFISPGQLLSTEGAATEGWVLLIHADFLQGYPLCKTIKDYGFFSYEVSEALFVSDKELQLLETILANIEQEFSANIDSYSQDIIITQLELLLNYANRFYNRQFITRKKVNTDLLTRLEGVLSDYFSKNQALVSGLPTVEYVAGQLNVSAHYLSDLLRSMTGQNAQQHIQNKLIEKAKEFLSTTTLSVGEIAYQLGFQYPQSFNKLFKNKTNVSPLQFRESFN